MLKKIFSQSLIYSLAPQLPRVISLLILPLLTKYLTPVDYGISATVMVFAGLFVGLKDLGITVLIVNAYYHSPLKWRFKWRIYYGYLLLWSPVIFVLSFTVIFFTVPPEANPNRFLIALLTALPFLLFEHTIMLGFRYFQTVQRNASYIATVLVVAGLFTVLSNYIAIVVFRLGYMGWIWSSFIGGAISMILYAYPVWFKLKLIPVFFLNRTYFLKQMRLALPMIPHTYSSYLLNASDRFVMSTLKVPISNIGVYNMAYTFGSYADIAGNSIGLAIGPVVNELLSKNKKYESDSLKRLIFFLQALFIIGLSLISLWMKEIFDLLITNPSLRQGYPLAIIILMSYSYRPIYWNWINRLIFFRKTNKIWRISFLSGLISVVLNFVFIPIYGFWIAAITTFISFMLLGFGGYFIADLKQVYTFRNSKIFVWLAIICLSLIIVYLLRDIAVMSKVLISIIPVSVIAFLFIRFYKAERYQQIEKVDPE